MLRFSVGLMALCNCMFYRVKWNIYGNCESGVERRVKEWP